MSIKRNPSKMNGDNLLQLKHMKNAEVSPRVLSFNMASRVEMSRKINWGYREQALNLEKVKKGQYLYYKQLKRLEHEKRTLQQQSYRYKQAEAKLDVEHEKRDKRIRKVLDEYEEKSRAIIEDILRAANQKKLKKRSVESELNGEEDEDGKKDEAAIEEEARRREAEERERQEEEERQRKAEEEERADSLEEEISSARDGSGNVRLRQVWKPADAEKHSERRGSVYIEYMYVKPGARTMTIEVVEQHNDKTKRRKSRVSPHHFESDSDSDSSSGRRRLSMRRRSSKTIEVNLKSPNEPKTVVRARSPEFTKGLDEQTTDLPPLKTVRNRTKEPPLNSVLLDNYHENGVHDAIAEVENANSVGVMIDLTLPKMEVPQASPKTRPSQQFKALPVISENQSLVSQGVAEEEAEGNFRESMLRDAQVLIITPAPALLEEEEDSRSRSSTPTSSDSHNSQKKPKKKQKNNYTEYKKQRQREREEENQKILQLPYTAYTMDKEGKVIPMEPPKPMDTKPPSNYARYQRHKLLQKTREKQKVENETLQKFMEKIGEYVKAMPPPPNPNPDISIEDVAHMIEGDTKKEETASRQMSLPGNLMIFLQNKYDELPEDMDPNSMEALARCKYLRDFDAEGAKEAKKAGRRQSSWKVNAQTDSSPRT